MKRLLLHRSVAQGQAGATVTVSDETARRLLWCPAIGSPPTATLVEDLGDDVPVLPVQVRILKACSAGGGPVDVGQVIRVSERDARLLVSLGRAELVSGVVPGATPLAGDDPVQAAARARSPLDRPLRKVGA